MRHLKHKKAPGRSSAIRVAYVREMMRGLVLHGRVVTTEARAKILRGEAERMITDVVHAVRASEDINARRDTVFRSLNPVMQFHGAPVAPSASGSMVDALIDVCNTLKDSKGGYLRVLKFRRRRGDGAPLAVVEWKAALEHLNGPSESGLSVVRSAAPHARAAETVAADAPAATETAATEPTGSTEG